MSPGLLVARVSPGSLVARVIVTPDNTDMLNTSSSTTSYCTVLYHTVLYHPPPGAKRYGPPIAPQKAQFRESAGTRTERSIAAYLGRSGLRMSKQSKSHPRSITFGPNRSHQLPIWRRSIVLYVVYVLYCRFGGGGTSPFATTVQEHSKTRPSEIGKVSGSVLRAQLARNPGCPKVCA